MAIGLGLFGLRGMPFTFHEPLHTDRESGVSTVSSQSLRRITLSEMRSCGYEYVEASANADLEVNFLRREPREGRKLP